MVARYICQFCDYKFESNKDERFCPLCDHGVDKVDKEPTYTDPIIVTNINDVHRVLKQFPEYTYSVIRGDNYRYNYLIYKKMENNHA